MALEGVQAAIDALTKQQVETVLDEWREVGRDAFLELHKVNRAARYKIRVGEQEFDAKAVVVVALRQFRVEFATLNARDVGSDENSIARPLRSIGFQIVIDDDEQLKMHDEAVAAEIRTLLQGDTSRMGEVWRLNQEGVSHKDIAARLGAKTHNFVNKLLRFATAIEVGDLPTARTMVEECRAKLKAFLVAHDKLLTESTRVVLDARLRALEIKMSQVRSLRDIFQEVLDLNKNYVQDNNAAPMKRRFELFKNELTPAFKQVVLESQSRSEWKVKGSSFSSGAVLGVPYIFSSDPLRAPSAPKNGLYFVILFAKDGSALYLSLNQGVTANTRAPLEENVVSCRSRLDGALGKASFGSISLADSGVGRRYEQSNIASIKYLDHQIPSDEEIFDDLDHMLELQQFLYKSLESERLVNQTLTEVIDDFKSAIEESGLIFSSQNELLPSMFLRAALVKRFCILGGLAGSGKTQLAKALGKWLGNTTDGSHRYLISPVRADWTTPDPVFGYEDALGVPQDGRKSWIVPEPLRFIQSAAKEPNRLWLLILDEMNIAHVERYFSDVLSGIESGEPVVPNVQLEVDGYWRIANGSKERVALPSNLIIVGTVNIDETTYQFSPKVLDRAFTFEFRVQTDELSNSARRPELIQTASEQTLDALSEVACSDEWHSELLTGVSGVFENLKILHQDLSEVGFEFGHRATFEILRFSVLSQQTGVSDDEILDWSIMTKILPRVHGSAQQLRGFFEKLIAFSEERNLKLSANKARRMNQIASANGFVSFAE
jgi:5-methylcytosine-specific restriction protein B